MSLHIFYLGANLSQQSNKFIPQYTFIYFIWKQTYHNKTLNFSPKKSIKFIPQYIFICFIWEQTYHNKALNFSQKKVLNSYLTTFLYILFRSKHITTNHNTFFKKWNKTQQNKINYTSITLKIGFFHSYVNKILSLYPRTFHLISLKNHL